MNAQNFILWSKWVHFENPENRDAKWECCVDDSSHCSTECETVFTICISRSNQKTSCNYLKHQTDVYNDGRVVEFGRENPITINVDSKVWSYVY